MNTKYGNCPRNAMCFPMLAVMALMIFFILCRHLRADNVFIGVFNEIDRELTITMEWLVVRVVALVVVIYVEAFVFSRMITLPFSRCLGMSSALNAFSATVGLCVGLLSTTLHGSIFSFVAAIVFFLFIVLMWKPPAWFWITSLAAILIGSPVTFTHYFGEHKTGLEAVLLTAFLLLLGFGTTLLTESFALIQFFKGVALSWFLTKTNVWHMIMVANIISYIVLVPAFILAPPFRCSL